MSDIFISYSHEDSEYLDELNTFLAPLADRINFWSDSRIEPGEKWDEEISNALDAAQIGLLLVSPNFLASSYIRNQELPRLVQAAEDGAVKLAVLYLKTSAVEDPGSAVTIEVGGEEQRVSLTKYQGLNSPRTPIGDINKQGSEEDRNKLYLRVSQELAKVAERVAGPTSKFRHAGDVPNELREPLKNALPPNIRLGELLTRGSRSILYRGFDETLQRTVAIKVADPTKLQANAFDDGLATIQAAAKLNHRGIMSVYHSVQHQRLLYTELEYVDGLPMSDLVRWGAQPMHKVLTLLERLADMLEYAHRRGCVHGSLTPSMIVVDHDGWPMISPFKLMTTNSVDPFRGDNFSLDALRYASPEQYEGSAAVTAATDQYALGLIAFELTSGQRVVTADRVPGIIAQKSSQLRRPPVVPVDRSECPAALRDLIARMLKRNPAQRWPSMRDVIDQLKLARSQLRSSLPPRLAKHHAQATASFDRLRGERSFFEDFYVRFLPRLDDKVRRRFPMDMEKQYRMLREALELLLLDPVEPDNPALRRVAELHGRPGGIGLDKNDYALFTRCLLAAVETHEGGAGGKQIAKAWERAIAPGMAYMKRHVGPVAAEPACAGELATPGPTALAAAENPEVVAVNGATLNLVSEYPYERAGCAEPRTGQAAPIVAPT